MARRGINANGAVEPSRKMTDRPSSDSLAPSISSFDPIQTMAGGPALGVAISSPGKYHLPSRGPRQEEQSPQDVYGVPESKWTEDQRFQHCIYSTVFATAIMGFVVWAMRDSLPPEGRTFGLTLQRTVIPIAIGAAVYFMAASGFLSREWDECKRMLASRWTRFWHSITLRS